MTDVSLILESVRYTDEIGFRYLISAEWMKTILSLVDKKESSQSLSIRSINNSQFIQEKGLDVSLRKIRNYEICLITREMMKCIDDNFEVDWVIRFPLRPGNVVDAKEAAIIKGSLFRRYETKHKGNKWKEENNIDKVYLLANDVTVIDSQAEDVIHVEAKVSSQTNMKLNNYTLKDHNTETTSPNNTGSTTANTTTKSNSLTIETSSNSLIAKLHDFQSIDVNPKGLSNPSVYCFMNTCMQCLASIPELNHYFLSRSFEKQKKIKTAAVACEALYDFLNHYQTSSTSLMIPKSLYRMCHSFLEPQQQHDCQEFLRRFLTKIQEELNYNKKYTFPDKTNHITAWSVYREVNPSFIDSLFTGLMRSGVKCNRCGYTSYTYDPFMDLSIPIKRRNGDTLDNCLDSYFSEEQIDCEYKCSSCKKKTSITKKLEISLSPPIVTIHFKRFEDMRHKINGGVQFPHQISLKDYTSNEVKGKLNYELIAVAVHIGRSISLGHYVAYGKRKGKWFYFNDSSVYTSSESEALSNDAYLLLYRMVA